jgi:hypothetical protein
MASATVQAQLRDEGEQTRVTVHTKLNVTGRPAQFGRNIMAEVGGKLINRFADNLAKEIAREEPAEVAPEASAAPAEAAVPEASAAPDARPQPAPEEPAPSGDGSPQAVAEPQAAPSPSPQAAPRPAAPRSSDDEAINLLEFAGPSIAKRLAPVIAGLAAVWALRRIVRRRRGSGE